MLLWSQQGLTRAYCTRVAGKTNAATPTTPAPEPKAQGAAAHSISRSGTGSSTPGSTRVTGEDPAGDQLSADRKATICRSVYEHMLQRGMTSEDGYLIVDVLHEVEAWITAQIKSN